jgi:hypothetical protein
VVLQLEDWAGGRKPFTTKNKHVTNVLHEPRSWTDSFGKLRKLWNMDMRFGTGKIRNLYRVGFVMTVSKELSKCKLDLVVQEVRWESRDTESAGEYKFFYGKGNENSELGIDLFLCVHKIIISS